MIKITANKDHWSCQACGRRVNTIGELKEIVMSVNHGLSIHSGALCKSCMSELYKSIGKALEEEWK